MNDRTTQHNIGTDADDLRCDRTTHPHSANDHNDSQCARTTCTTNDDMRNTVTDYLTAVIVAASIGLTLTFAVTALAAGAVAIPAVLAIVVACALTVVAYWHPLFSGHAVTLSWACACLMPPLTGGVTLMILPVACCVMLAARHNTRHGFMMTGAQLLTLAAGTMLGVVRPADDSAMMAVLVTIPAAPVAGLLMAWKQRLDDAKEAERELERRRHAMREQERRAAVATRIHDQVTNRLAYLILRLGNDRAEWTADAPDTARLRAELTDLSSIAQDVLDETRTVIGILDGSRPPTTDADADDDPAGEAAMLRDHLHETADRLEALGFAVDADCFGTLPQRYDIDAVNVLHDLIDETGNNIAKHAQPRTDCAIRITLDGCQATLVSSNHIRTDDAGSGNSGTAIRPGTGLRTKAEQLHRLGGALDHTVQDATWTLSAHLPLHRQSVAPSLQ
ncbi:histidine kinase [Bifidobacterium ramosum]|uniref:histidine kinase n=1 Tax=Bifidobacterium ramosum TaxID=1798158 RepID=A0A6L4X3U2_9BIFI|nr:hypothetical protein [Bifidobacterium ramosum]KAB8289396.1 histidine kinase [Bifidobacterium ramosum]NEG71095.1 hypothetical protein [Bifidobacterium ramosum]